MPIPTYTPGYPPDGSSLGQTKATIRNNLDGTFETLNVDHVNNNGQPGSNPAGYHTIIHEVTQTNVATVNGVNQIFSGVPGTLSVNATTTAAIPNNGDTQLYALTGNGILSQLTGSLRTTNGYVWIAGILIQWGVKDTPGTSGSVNFSDANVNFPNNCFNVSLTVKSNTNTSLPKLISTPTPTSFSYALQGISAQSLFWIAIGN